MIHTTPVMDNINIVSTGSSTKDNPILPELLKIVKSGKM